MPGAIMFLAQELGRFSQEELAFKRSTYISFLTENILQGLGVGPGSTIKRWPCRKNARKSILFFVKKLKITLNFF